MAERISEKSLYVHVEKWMRRHFRCFKTAIDRGLKHSRVDVIGIRDIGGDLSGDIETIAIEVKRGRRPFAKSSGQTLGYKVYANRVYLADYRDEPFTPDETNIASHLGIGLIQIKGKTCKEFLSSPHYEPITRMNLELLERISLGKCQICGTFFEIGEQDGKRYSNVTRERIKRAIEEEKGIMFWNRELADRKRKLGIRAPEKDITYERRFICDECIQNIFAPLNDQP